MGLFDTVKLKANALAADAERAGKVTAAQARTVVLQNEIRKAERELGHSAFSLIESDEIAHPDLEAAVARLREAWQPRTTRKPRPRKPAAAKKPATAKKATSRKMKTVTEGPLARELIAEARSGIHARSHLTG